MRKIIQFLLNRVVVVALLLFVQFALLVLTLWYFNDLSVYFYIFEALLGIVIVLGIVNSWTNPDYKVAWIIPVLLLPVVGGLLYLLFGGVRIRRSKREHMQEIERHARIALAHDGVPGAEENLWQAHPAAARQSHYIRYATGTPLFANTHTEYLPLGEVFHQRLLAELEKAEKYIFLEYFIIQPGKMWDPVLALLARKAAEGLDVRVIYDDMGCSFTLPARYYKKLEALGIRCGVFSPFVPVLTSRFNNRSHRKTTVVDGHVAFTGGINLADEYINAYEKHGHWKDTAILLQGDAVWGFTVQFLTMWEGIKNEPPDYAAYRPTLPPPAGARGFAQPYTDSPLDGELVGETVYMNMITAAERYLYITTPYLVVDNEMLTALRNAAKSGVDVRIITPGKEDKWYVHPVTRSYYEPLLASGVRIYEYSPGFIHAKSFVVDDECAVVGTVNLDYRSLHLHYENGVWLYKAAAVTQVRDDFVQTLEKCEEMSLEACRRTPWYKRLGRSVLRVFAPLM